MAKRKQNYMLVCTQSLSLSLSTHMLSRFTNIAVYIFTM